jgi:hypothetical protein
MDGLSMMGAGIRCAQEQIKFSRCLTLSEKNVTLR